MNSIGNNIKLTFFGESHSKYIGITIDNIPAGLKIDNNLIDFNLKKRRPDPKVSTSRVEEDKYDFVSGILNGVTTGAALTVLIENSKFNSNDYSKQRDIPRPSHADYPAYIKYKGYNDIRGGGVFSGRLTALWMIIGSLAEQILSQKNIIVSSHIQNLHNLKDQSFDMININESLLLNLKREKFPVINENTKIKYLELIDKTKLSKDSIGGVVESAIINLPIGLGEPLFLSMESYISQLIFSIPSVKAVEFGKGFEITKHFGSEMNDEYRYTEKTIKLKSNNNGGILGGLSTGAPVIIRTAIKPTPSIGIKQESINLKTKENTNLEINGRHDPQIVSRAIHVIDAVLHFAILDLMISNYKWDVLK